MIRGLGQVINQIISNPGGRLDNPAHHAGVDDLTSRHGPNRIDDIGFRYFLLRPHLHDTVGCGIDPDAARFVGSHCRLRLRDKFMA